eukprot:TRINITY_DN8254_c0_g2_i1.p1 TRINITY_DN8254_c0_g2~~TRINITY_DN8254_c0_g2_i1.p1  ORF type:complete len:1583 (+),score=196.49 TRINITY_DN8254_c0_g2_i1:139-4887(+)
MRHFLAAAVSSTASTYIGLTFLSDLILVLLGTIFLSSFIEGAIVLDVEKYSGCGLASSISSSFVRTEPFDVCTPSEWEHALPAGSVVARLTLPGNDNIYGCNPYAAGSLLGKIPLVARGACYFVQKGALAERAGAAAILLYDNTSPTTLALLAVAGSSPIPRIPGFLIDRLTGVNLRMRLMSGEKLSVACQWKPVVAWFGVPRSVQLGNNLSLVVSNAGSSPLRWRPEVRQWLSGGAQVEDPLDVLYGSSSQVSSWTRTDFAQSLATLNKTTQFDLPFSFPLYSTFVDTLHVSTKGLLMLGSSFDPEVVDGVYSSLGSVAPPNGFIAPCWDNLRCDGCQIMAGVVRSGFVSNKTDDMDVFVVQYKNVSFVDNNVTFTCEARLFADGRIDLISALPEFAARRSSLKVGIESMDGLNHLSVENKVVSSLEAPVSTSLIPWFLPQLPRWDSSTVQAAGSFRFHFALERTSSSRGWLQFYEAIDSEGSGQTRWKMARQTRIVQRDYECRWVIGVWDGGFHSGSCLNSSQRSRNVSCVDSTAAAVPCRSCLGSCRDVPHAASSTVSWEATDVAGNALHPWRDKLGRSCADYRALALCRTSGVRGDAWRSHWGSIEDFAVAGEPSALQACCACGGGIHSSPEELEPCRSIACPSNSSGASVLVGCTCRPGFRGRIVVTTGSPYYVGKCEQVPCPPHSFGESVADGCACEPGYVGEVRPSSTDLGFHGGCALATGTPTHAPTLALTLTPTAAPVAAPTTPSLGPTEELAVPSSASLTDIPTTEPTMLPTRAPTAPALAPTAVLTTAPTAHLTAPATILSIDPTETPEEPFAAVLTDVPTVEPTILPTRAPTALAPAPTAASTAAPTPNLTAPTITPSIKPTEKLTVPPATSLTDVPALKPTIVPTQAPMPLSMPPSAEDSLETLPFAPTTFPSFEHSAAPFASPTSAPTPRKQITYIEAANVSIGMSARPTLEPTLSSLFTNLSTATTVSPVLAPSVSPIAANSTSDKPVALFSRVPQMPAPWNASTATTTSTTMMLAQSLLTASPAALPTNAEYFTPTLFPTKLPSLLIKKTISPTTSPIPLPAQNLSTIPTLLPTVALAHFKPRREANVSSIASSIKSVSPSPGNPHTAPYLTFEPSSLPTQAQIVHPTVMPPYVGAVTVMPSASTVESSARPPSVAPTAQQQQFRPQQQQEQHSAEHVDGLVAGSQFAAVIGSVLFIILTCAVVSAWRYLRYWRRLGLSTDAPLFDTIGPAAPASAIEKTVKVPERGATATSTSVFAALPALANAWRQNWCCPCSRSSSIVMGCRSDPELDSDALSSQDERDLDQTPTVDADAEVVCEFVGEANRRRCSIRKSEEESIPLFVGELCEATVESSYQSIEVNRSQETIVFTKSRYDQTQGSRCPSDIIHECVASVVSSLDAGRDHLDSMVPASENNFDDIPTVSYGADDSLVDVPLQSKLFEQAHTNQTSEPIPEVCDCIESSSGDTSNDSAFRCARKPTEEVVFDAQQHVAADVRGNDSKLLAGLHTTNSTSCLGVPNRVISSKSLQDDDAPMDGEGKEVLRVIIKSRAHQTIESSFESGMGVSEAA